MKLQILFCILTFILAVGGSGCCCQSTKSPEETATTQVKGTSNTWIFSSEIVQFPTDRPYIKLANVSPVLGAPPLVLEYEGWEYRVSVPNRSSMSSVLIYNDREVKPDRIGQIINTPFGPMKYISQIDPYRISGWYYQKEPAK